MEVLATIIDMVDLRLGLALLNLHWFLLNQIALIMLMIAAVMTSLHWGPQPRLQRFQRSSVEVIVKWRLIKLLNQFHMLEAKRQSKNKCSMVSEQQKQREQTEGKRQPLIVSLSSNGSLWCINLQTKKDLAGGIDGYQTSLDQKRCWPWGDIWR
jgi:hypothetical protein